MLFLGEGIPEHWCNTTEFEITPERKSSDGVMFALISPVEIAVLVSWCVVLNYDKLSDNTNLFSYSFGVQKSKISLPELNPGHQEDWFLLKALKGKSPLLPFFFLTSKITWIP